MAKIVLADVDLAATTKVKNLELKPVRAVVEMEAEGPKGSKLPPLLEQRMKKTATSLLMEAQKNFKEYAEKTDKKLDEALVQARAACDQTRRKRGDMDETNRKNGASIYKIMEGYNVQCDRAINLEVANATKMAGQEQEFLAKSQKDVTKWKLKLGFKIAGRSLLILAKFTTALAVAGGAIGVSVASYGAGAALIVPAAGATFGASVSAIKDIVVLIKDVATQWDSLDERQVSVESLIAAINKEHELSSDKTKGKLDKLKNMKNKITNLVASKVDKVSGELKNYDTMLKRVEVDSMKLSKKVTEAFDLTVKGEEMVKSHKQALAEAKKMGDKMKAVKLGIELTEVQLAEGRRWRNNRSAEVLSFKKKGGKFSAATNKTAGVGKKLMPLVPIAVDVGKFGASVGRIILTVV